MPETKRYADKTTSPGTKVSDNLGWKQAIFVGISGHDMWAKISARCCELPDELHATAKSLGLDPFCGEYGNFGSNPTRLEIIEEPKAADPPKPAISSKPIDPKNPHDLKIGTKIRIGDRDGVVVGFQDGGVWFAYTNGPYFENNNGCVLPGSFREEATRLGFDTNKRYFDMINTSSSSIKVVEQPVKRLLTKTTPIGSKLWINNFEEATFLGFVGELAWVKLNRACAPLNTPDPNIHANIASLGLDPKANYYGGVFADTAEIIEEPKPVEKPMSDIKRLTKDTAPGAKIRVAGSNAIFVAWDHRYEYLWAKMEKDCIYLDPGAKDGPPGKTAALLGFDPAKPCYGAYYTGSVELLEEATTATTTKPTETTSTQEQAVKQETKQYLTESSKPGTKFMRNGREATLLGFIDGRTVYRYVAPVSGDLSLTTHSDDEYAALAKAMGLDHSERAYGYTFGPNGTQCEITEEPEEPKTAKSIAGLLIAGTLLGSALGAWMKASGTSTSVRAEEVVELLPDEVEVEFDQEAIS